MNLSNFGLAEGRAASDPTIRTNKDGSKKAFLTIAVQNNYKNKSTGKRDVQFIPVEGFVPKDTQGNGVYDLIHKGDKIAVAYELRNDSFEKNGTTEYRLVAKINQVDLKESKTVTDARLASRSDAAQVEPDEAPFN